MTWTVQRRVEDGKRNLVCVGGSKLGTGRGYGAMPLFRVQLSVVLLLAGPEVVSAEWTAAGR